MNKEKMKNILEGVGKIFGLIGIALAMCAVGYGMLWLMLFGIPAYEQKALYESHKKAVEYCNEYPTLHEDCEEITGKATDI